MIRSRPLVTAVCMVVLATGVANAQVATADRSRAHPGEAVRAWMSERLEAFGLVDGVDALRLEREEPLPGGATRVLVQQLWHGLPVAGADARAILSADGRITALISGFEPGLNAPLEPRVASERAGSVAARAAALPAAAALEATTLVVVRRANGDHLAWHVVHARADGERVRTLVDAITGEVIEVDAGIAHAVGRVYPTDPRQPLEERELPRLLPGPPLGAPGFGIDDVVDPLALPVAPGDYRYLPADPSFDQVNTFWHVDHYLHDFLGSLGYPGPPDSVIVRIHFPLNPGVAQTDGSLVLLGGPIPGFCLEPSRSHDILYHELGHTVLYGYGIRPGGPNREANALHEALADYFSAAFTGDPAIGEWLYIVFPAGATRVDQPSPPWDYAHYDRVAFAGGALGTSWGNGMILSSGLWELRQRIGATSDSLVLESLVYLPTVPTWGQFANAVFLADMDHHGGRDWPEIARMFLHRGIHGSVLASISGPSTLAPAQPGVFEAFPCCDGAPGRYHWRSRTWCRGMPCSAWQDLADGDTLRTAFLADAELELTAASAFGDTARALKRILVESPSLAIEGPLRVPRNATGSWTARVVAASPMRLVWSRRWLRPGAVVEELGRETNVSFKVEAPFELTVTLQDAMGRILLRQVNVDAFTDKPPRDSPASVRVTMTMDAALHVETHVELEKDTSLHLAVYDVRGRERMRLADGPAARGERVVHWDASPLEPGVYFLRASTAEGHDDAARFIVLH